MWIIKHLQKLDQNYASRKGKFFDLKLLIPIFFWPLIFWHIFFLCEQKIMLVTKLCQQKSSSMLFGIMVSVNWPRLILKIKKLIAKKTCSFKSTSTISVIICTSEGIGKYDFIRLIAFLTLIISNCPSYLKLKATTWLFRANFWPLVFLTPQIDHIKTLKAANKTMLGRKVAVYL